MTGRSRFFLLFGGTAVLVVASTLFYIPVIRAWSQHWPSYRSMLGTRQVEVVQVDLTPVMRAGESIYRPALRLHATALGWFEVAIADGDSSGSMLFARDARAVP